MTDTLPVLMRAAASHLLTTLDEEQLARATRGFADDEARRWIEYRPRPRPGVSLAGLPGAARKAVHRLLATALSPHAYAQVMAVASLEEVLDRKEGWGRGRHSDDYWIAVFGSPGDERWAWRFEGHHVSITMTVAGDRISPSPVFLGANPARVSYRGRDVSRPLAPEEDMARELLAALGQGHRSAAIVADEAPFDIVSGTSARAEAWIQPLGLASSDLPLGARGMLDELVALYLDRLPEEIALAESRRLTGPLHFAWAGSTDPGRRHYYRIQGEDLLIEYDNTSDDGNHAHTVFRRPASDFGDDILTRHRADDHRS